MQRCPQRQNVLIEHHGLIVHGLSVAGVLLRRSGPQQHVGAGQLIGKRGEVLGALPP